MQLRSTSAAIIVILAVSAAMLVVETIRTGPIRESVGTLTELISAVNREDLNTAQSLCTEDYLRRGGLEVASEGGLVGLPRTIHKNFRAWRERGDVLICPTGRVGPVYRFVLEDGDRRFDGMAGVIGPSNSLKATP